MTAFGEKLKRARLAKNLHQAELGGLIGESGATISNWERGVSRPDIDDIPAIVKALEVGANYFFESFDVPSKEGETGFTVKIKDDLEFAFLMGYRDLNDEEREEINRAANRMLELKKLKGK